jgi:branched-chain amino acid transport system permease protein
MLLGQLLNGLVTGSMYALVAIGFTLILGVLDRLNFAHPETFMLGGFAGVLVAEAGLPIELSVPIAIAIGVAAGFVIEFVSFRKFTGTDARITSALSSLAVGLIAVDLVHKVWGTEPRTIRLAGSWLNETMTVFGLRLGVVQVVALVLALVLGVGLHLMLAHSRVGRAVRAVADNPEAAELLGVDRLRVTVTVFAVSSALAAIAGLLLALKTGSANADIGLAFGLKALAIMAIGGLGDMRGALIAGPAVGIMEALAFHFGLGQVSEMLVWLAMILLLLVKPGGLFVTGLHAGAKRA